MAAFLLKWASQASVQLGTATTTRNEGNADHYLSRMLGTRNQRDLLRDAVLKKRCQMLWLLLSHGADPLGMDSDGKTLLDHAKTVKDNTEVVNLLTRYYRSCLVTDNFGLFTEIAVCKFLRGWRSYVA